jgi:hypothetical protein
MGLRQEGIEFVSLDIKRDRMRTPLGLHCLDAL